MRIRDRILEIQASVALKVRQTIFAFRLIEVTATCLFYLHYNKNKYVTSIKQSSQDSNK